MKVLTNFFSSAATKRPIITIIVVLILTGFFGFMAGQAEELSTSFGGELDTPEIQASSKLGEYFQTSGSQSVFQIIVSGEDVLTVDGYTAWQEINKAVLQSEIYPYLVKDQGGAVQGFFAPVDFAKAFNPTLNVSAMSDEQFKQLYNQSNGQMPPEFKAFAAALLSSTYDEDATTASAGLAIVTIDSSLIVQEFGGSDGAFIEQPRMEVALSEALSEISIGDIKVSGFSFGLLLGNEGDDFLAEIGILFGQAFLIILVVLAYIFFIRPRKGFGILKSGRRTFSDLLLSLGAILLSIGWMQGAGTILGPGYLNIIGAPNQVSQIAPIILIGLGVDYAIHFTSRYREEIGSGNSIVGSTSSTLKSVGIALTLATLATIVGFLTNIVSPLPELKDFGILVSTGIFFAFFLVMTFVPAIRTLLDKRAELKGNISNEAFSSSGESVLNKIAASSGIIPKKFKLVALALLIGISGYGYFSFTNLETIFEFTDFLPEDDPVVQTLDLLTEEFGGGFGETTSVLIEGDNLATPDVHNALIDSINNLSDKENIVVYAGNVAAESLIGTVGQLLAPQGAAPGAPPAMPDMELLGTLGSFGVDLMSGSQGIDALRVKESGDVQGLYEYLVSSDPEAFLANLYFNEENLVTAQQVRITTSAGSLGAAQLRDDIYDAFIPLSSLGVDIAATNDSIVT